MEAFFYCLKSWILDFVCKKEFNFLTLSNFGPGDGISRDQGQEFEELHTVAKIGEEILDFVVLLHQVGVDPLGKGLLLHVGAVIL